MIKHRVKLVLVECIYVSAMIKNEFCVSTWNIMEDMMENVKLDIYRKNIGPFYEHVRLNKIYDRSGNQDAHFLIPDKILNQKPPSNLLHSDVTILAAGSLTIMIHLSQK